MLSRASLLRGRPSAAAVRRRRPYIVAYRSLATSLAHQPSSMHITCHSPPQLTSPSSGPRPWRTQTRPFAGRKDRAATALETRQPTKKQLKKYHRRVRDRDREANKHSPPHSKAAHRKREERERTEMLIDIAKEEERLKLQVGRHFDKVRELQSKIEKSPKFQALVEEGNTSPEELREAARAAATKAAEKEVPKPPLPSWIEERMTYDWGDALVDDLMGNSADLTSSPSPFPTHMGGEYGRLKRRVERLVRGKKEEERFLLEGPRMGQQSVLGSGSAATDANGANDVSVPEANGLPSLNGTPSDGPSDQLLSDLIRAHRDAHGKRTAPVGLAATLQLLHDVEVPLSSLGTWSFASLLTCCKNPWEGRKVDELRRECGVRSNGYFWSSLVDVHARSGDYRGAENVLDEMLAETQAERDNPGLFGKNDQIGSNIDGPLAVPPLPAYTSFLAACYKLISRPDVHPKVKADAGDRAWARWKEMRIHSVAPDVMAYGALMRIFAAQGRAERAVDLLEEIMDQMMVPVASGDVVGKNASGIISEEGLDGLTGEEDGWHDDRDGNTVRVKPTTLIFTSALQAVRKSHEAASRFSGGNSKKHRRRESIAAHHGRLARQIVVLAEQAEVVQDDGFVAALMLCAAAAGDSSTARAIYLASKVRRLDHLRTCGGKDHLLRLQGLVPDEDRRTMMGEGDGPSLLGSGLTGALPATTGDGEATPHPPMLRSIEDEFADDHAAYEHREYGNDTRVPSALLLSHAKAMEPKGLGSMWKGRYNRGYLCHNSLRYLEAYNVPQKENLAIPDLDGTKAGLSSEGWMTHEEMGGDEGRGGSSKRLRKRHKFSIQSIMDDGAGNRRDDMDEFFDGMDEDPDEARLRELRLLDHPLVAPAEGGEGDVKKIEMSRDWLNDRLVPKEVRDFDPDGVATAEYRPGKKLEVAASEATNADQFGNEFDSDSDEESDDEPDKEGQYSSEAQKTEHDKLVEAMAEITEDRKLAEDLVFRGGDPDGEEGDDDEEFDPDSLFDEEEFAKLMADTETGIDESKGGDAEELSSIPGVSTDDFGAFRAHLKAELVQEGATHDVEEAEARQLFDMMRTYYDDGNTGGASSADSFAETTEATFSPDSSSVNNAVNGAALEQSLGTHTEEGPVPEMQRSPAASMDPASKTIYADDYIEWAHSQNGQPAAEASNGLALSEETAISEVEPPKLPDIPLPKQFMSPLALEEEDPHIAELQKHLPGLPMSRLVKVSEAFEGTLGYPSILKLALAVRENMPEAFSPQCLVRKNLANAMHLMNEAEGEGLVDAHLLNGMLRVYTNSGRIEPAMRFYDAEFKKHGLAPTTHSDRLLFEMLINKKRLARAFKLKQDIERDGRALDLLSYGSLVEYYGRRNQLGSALLLIKECIDMHGSPPGEKSLKNIRLMCRQRGLTDDVGLEKLVGKDHLEWLRRGQETQKHLNKTKRGKSSAMLYGQNRFLDI
ncbi:hypothetical protein ACHAXT_013251 [Thalassiosira profunda]